MLLLLLLLALLPLLLTAVAAAVTALAVSTDVPTGMANNRSRSTTDVGANDDGAIVGDDIRLLALLLLPLLLPLAAAVNFDEKDADDDTGANNEPT